MLLILISLISQSFNIAVYRMTEFPKMERKIKLFGQPIILIWFTSAFQDASVVYEI